MRQIICKAPLRTYIFLLNISYLTFLIAGCQTLTGPSEEEQKQQDIVRTQKSLVISFLNKGLPGIALKELRNHIKDHPKDPDFRNLMGLTLLALKTPQKSIKYFQQAINIEDKISYSLNLGSAYIEAQQYNLALKTLHKLRKHREFEDYRHPERITHNLGLSSEKLGRLQDAEKYYRMALRQNPNFYISLMRLAQIYENRKQHKKALGLFKKAKEVCDVCFDPVNGMAMTYLSMKQPKRALIVLNRFMKKKSTSKEDKKKAQQMIRMSLKKTPNRSQRL